MKSNNDLLLMSFYGVTIVAVFLLSLQSAIAQDDAEKAKEKEIKPPTQIALVAVGPKPPRRYKSNGDGPPTMLLPSPGEVPPSRLYFKAGPSKAKKSGTAKKSSKPNWQVFNVAFNNPSAMKNITPEKALELYHKDKKSGEYVKYVSIPPGAVGSRRVFFLIPSTTGKQLWNKPPLVRTIDLDSKTLQGKQFILKNLSDFTVLHAFADSVTAVPPMKTISYTRPKSGELYRLAARYGTHKKIIYNTAVRLDTKGNIQLFALYNASPKTNSGRSVGVFRMMIPVRQITETSSP